MLFIHWIADFILQSDELAKNKSTSISSLIEHAFIYTVVWIIPLISYGIICQIPPSLLLFIPITFVCHTVTDFYTSRVNKMLWEIKEQTAGSPHNFFVSIGFDQFLHYVQLILTAKYLLG